MRARKRALDSRMKALHWGEEEWKSAPEHGGGPSTVSPAKSRSVPVQAYTAASMAAAHLRQDWVDHCLTVPSLIRGEKKGLVPKMRRLSNGQVLQQDLTSLTKRKGQLTYAR